VHHTLALRGLYQPLLEAVPDGRYLGIGVNTLSLS